MSYQQVHLSLEKDNTHAGERSQTNEARGQSTDRPKPNESERPREQARRKASEEAESNPQGLVHRWMEKEWRVCVESGRTDSQGWEYAFNWGRPFSPHAVTDGVASDFVRRRRWQRRAAKPLG